MKILHIIPGSGGSFYCGNCLRDSKVVPALKALGHEVVKIPMYLPLFANQEENGDMPIFYGAISIYLKQRYPTFKKAPAWVDGLLNSKPMLRLAAHFSGSTDAKGLETMTISMLMGEEGQQSEELERMVNWIANHYQPDVIHLSNALLLGVAKTLKNRLNTLVVCSLQDEDVWIDAMEPNYRDQVWGLMQRAVNHVDLFVAVSDWYAGEMKLKMQIPEEKLTSLHIGVDPSDYKSVPIENKPRAIGFVSRMCHDNGLDLLVEAFVGLKKLSGFEDVSLVITGGSTGADTHFLNRIRTTIKKNHLAGQVHFHEDFSPEGLKTFHEKVSVISVPVRNGEAFGIYLLEAMASGVPVVQPALGAFPEIITQSGGGMIYEPNEPAALTQALAMILSQPELLASLSLNGTSSIARDFNVHQQALQMIALYERCLSLQNC